MLFAFMNQGFTTHAPGVIVGISLNCSIIEVLFQKMECIIDIVFSKKKLSLTIDNLFNKDAILEVVAILCNATLLRSVRCNLSAQCIGIALLSSIWMDDFVGMSIACVKGLCCASFQIASR